MKQNLVFVRFIDTLAVT